MQGLAQQASAVTKQIQGLAQQARSVASAAATAPQRLRAGWNVLVERGQAAIATLRGVAIASVRMGQMMVSYALAGVRSLAVGLVSLATSAVPALLVGL